MNGETMGLNPRQYKISQAQKAVEEARAKLDEAIEKLKDTEREWEEPAVGTTMVFMIKTTNGQKKRIVATRAHGSAGVHGWAILRYSPEGGGADFHWWTWDDLRNKMHQWREDGNMLSQPYHMTAYQRVYEFPDVDLVPGQLR